MAAAIGSAPEIGGVTFSSLPDKVVNCADKVPQGRHEGCEEIG
jgi:hypothetical protein